MPLHCDLCLVVVSQREFLFWVEWELATGKKPCTNPLLMCNPGENRRSSASGADAELVHGYLAAGGRNLHETPSSRNRLIESSSLPITYS